MEEEKAKLEREYEGIRDKIYDSNFPDYDGGNNLMSLGEYAGNISWFLSGAYRYKETGRGQEAARRAMEFMRRMNSPCTPIKKIYAPTRKQYQSMDCFLRSNSPKDPDGRRKWIKRVKGLDLDTGLVYKLSQLI